MESFMTSSQQQQQIITLVIIITAVVVVTIILLYRIPHETYSTCMCVVVFSYAIFIGILIIFSTNKLIKAKQG